MSNRLQGSGWFAVPNFIYDIGLSPQEVALITYLLRRAGNNGCAWPSVKRICQDTGISRRNFFRVAKALSARSLLEIKPRPGSSSRYFLTLDEGCAKNDGGATQAPSSATQAPLGVPHRHPEEDTDEEETRRREMASPSGASAPVSRVPWDRHLKRANEVNSLMGLPSWQKLTEDRRTILRRRFKEEGLSLGDPDASWDTIQATLQKIHPTRYETWSKVDLGIFLRIPTRGKPDHYLSAQEGQYQEPWDQDRGKTTKPEGIGSLIVNRGAEEEEERERQRYRKKHSEMMKRPWQGF